MPNIDRRSLLVSAAATSALAASTASGVRATVMTTPDLSGKSVLITGCSSGFGEASARYLAGLGAKVFATMRNLPRPEAAALEKIARDEKLDITVLELDVLDDARVASAVAEAERLAGGALDVVVNNAGIGISGPIEVQDMEATKLAFDTNVFGYYRVARAALPAMRARKIGQIFAISSQLGRVITPYGGHYSANKFAVEAMFEQLAYELVPHNIDVTIIEPGGYPTKVWVNRNGYTGALKDRAPEIHKAGYPQVVAAMGTEDGSGRTASMLDIPQALAEIIGMPPGTRPLRRAVSGGGIPQTEINRVCAETQVGWLGRSERLGPLIRAVHRV